MKALALTALYLATIVGANWAISEFGVVPVGFGLMAPAAVYFAGLAFTLRDFLQDAGGRIVVFVAIAVGGALSFLVASPALAIASAAAFTISELADFMIYDPLRRSGRSVLAVAASNTVGLTIDSLIFLWLAFGSLAFLPGQIVGKAWMTLPAIAFVLIRSRRKIAVA